MHHLLLLRLRLDSLGVYGVGSILRCCSPEAVDLEVLLSNSVARSLPLPCSLLSPEFALLQHHSVSPSGSAAQIGEVAAARSARRRDG